MRDWKKLLGERPVQLLLNLRPGVYLKPEGDLWFPGAWTGTEVLALHSKQLIRRPHGLRDPLRLRNTVMGKSKWWEISPLGQQIQGLLNGTPYMSPYARRRLRVIIAYGGGVTQLSGRRWCPVRSCSGLTLNEGTVKFLIDLGYLARTSKHLAEVTDLGRKAAKLKDPFEPAAERV